MTTVAIIPARLQSSRLPRKALADICGMPMVVHVYKRCLLSLELSDVYIATDSDEIKEVAEDANCQVIMTSSEHATGTDRIAEAAREIDAEIVVDVQGDEALVNPVSIDKVVQPLIQDSSLNMGILVNPFNRRNSTSDIKVVVDENMDVLYMSRADLPSDARTKNPDLLKAYHIIPYRKNFLLQYASWTPGYLETTEYNEFLRGLEKGHKIRAVRVESDAISVDTEEDLEIVRDLMRDDKIFPKYKGAI